jgi:hypothetical protein
MVIDTLPLAVRDCPTCHVTSLVLDVDGTRETCRVCGVSLTPAVHFPPMLRLTYAVRRALFTHIRTGIPQ